MKVNSRILTFLPKARYVVTKTGVKSIAFDTVFGRQMIANLSKEKAYG